MSGSLVWPQLGSALMSVTQFSPNATCMPWGPRPSMAMWVPMGHTIVWSEWPTLSARATDSIKQAITGVEGLIWVCDLWQPGYGLITVAPDTTKGFVNTWGLGHSLKSGGDLRVMLSHAAAEGIQNWVDCALNWDHATILARATVQGQFWSMALPQSGSGLMSVHPDTIKAMLMSGISAAFWDHIGVQGPWYYGHPADLIVLSCHLGPWWHLSLG